MSPEQVLKNKVDELNQKLESVVLEKRLADETRNYMQLERVSDPGCQTESQSLLLLAKLLTTDVSCPIANRSRPLSGREESNKELFVLL